MSQRIRQILPALVLAALGLAVSINIAVVHHRLAADANYASYCNVNATVNCDVVLSSRYAKFLGVSVAAWAIVFYAGLIGLAVAVGRAAGALWRQRWVGLLFLAVGWAVLFSAYLAGVALFVLHAICLMCSALYLINLGLLIAAWRLRAVVRPVGRRTEASLWRENRLVWGGAVAAAVLLLGIGTWETLGGVDDFTGPEDVARRQPDFYQWYQAQPMAQRSLDGGSNARGPADAPVTIVEFSDFACAHCAALHRSLDEVLHRYGRSVRVVFRHFPLDSACNAAMTAAPHPDACLAAAAAECAGEQGKFWPYHDLLFDNQQQLSRPFLLRYAERVGMDMAHFTQCLAGGEAAARVRADAEAGARLGIDSTPTLFINGRSIKGALDSQRLVAAISMARAGR